MGVEMTVYILTLYDPAASFGYTEVFYTLKAAMKYAGVRGWKKRGTTYTWNNGEITVREKHGLISWSEDTSIYKIRRKRIHGRKP